MSVAANYERKDIINTLIITTNGRSISLVSGSAPTSNSRGYDRCMFIVGEEWQGLTKSAVFWQDKSSRYEMLLDDADSCDIPWEAQTRDGYLFVGLIGRKDGVTLASKIMAVPVFEGAQDGSEEHLPSADIISEMMARMNACVESCNEASESAAALAASMPYINSDGYWMVYDSASKEYVNSEVSALGQTAGGDMLASTYDKTGNGIVDNSEKLGGVASDSYATKDYVAQQIDTQITSALEGSY